MIRRRKCTVAMLPFFPHFSGSGEILAPGGVDEAGVGALEVPEGPREVGFAGLIAEVFSITLLHAFMAVAVSTVGPLTVETGVTDDLVPVVTLLPVLRLHFPVPTHPDPVRNLLCGLERLEGLYGLPSVLVFEVEHPLVLPECYGVVRFETAHLFFTVYHEYSGDSVETIPLCVASVRGIV